MVCLTTTRPLPIFPRVYIYAVGKNGPAVPRFGPKRGKTG